MTKDSNDSIFYDLVDYGRDHIISEWLRENGEPAMAECLCKIDSKLDDTDYFASMASIILSKSVSGPQRPRFKDCFKLEKISCSLNYVGYYIILHLKLIQEKNDTFKLFATNGFSNAECYIDTRNYFKGQSLIVSILIKRTSLECISSDIQVTDDVDIVAIIPNNEISRDDEKTVVLINTIPITLVKVEGGNFEMGGTHEQGIDASLEEKSIKRKVEVPGFYIMDTTVTQMLWNSVMETNPSKMKGMQRPVTNISYIESIDFIEKINKLTGVNFRLPSEEEWEYVARGGQKDEGCKYSGLKISSHSDEEKLLDNYAWFNFNSNHVIHDVKQKRPNLLGVYDMSGNVWEWCFSVWSDASENSRNDNYFRVSKGGCAQSTRRGCRVSRRYHSNIYHKSPYVGFRLVLSYDKEKEQQWNIESKILLNQLNK